MTPFDSIDLISASGLWQATSQRLQWGSVSEAVGAIGSLCAVAVSLLLASRAAKSNKETQQENLRLKTQAQDEIRSHRQQMLVEELAQVQAADIWFNVSARTSADGGPGFAIHIRNDSGKPLKKARIEWTNPDGKPASQKVPSKGFKYNPQIVDVKNPAGAATPGISLVFRDVRANEWRLQRDARLVLVSRRKIALEEADAKYQSFESSSAA